VAGLVNSSSSGSRLTEHGECTSIYTLRRAVFVYFLGPIFYVIRRHWVFLKIEIFRSRRSFRLRLVP